MKYPMHKYLLIPIFTIAWLLHGISEWAYSAADYLYHKCGTDIVQANIKWED